MQLTVTPLEDVGVEVLPPDIVWNGYVGDFAVSASPADGGVGGLVARNPIQTAVLLLLFTDAKADPSDLRFEQHSDGRGWVGDGFDIDVANGEAALGSRLWLYRRSVLVAKTFSQIEAEIRSALKPLISQGVAVQIDISGEILNAQGQIRCAIDIYGRNKTKVYSAKFDPLWRRADGL
ncbi:phage GP46 family protein [Lichenihabitans sp. PAMC28606]|uniref:phage GP46 family protein n=1 Tax=Lichenihabitans sp. PAMC28606 TaxID=2880932 RepID=UPI001D0BA493|nr:phage GP46 family protein [Lichenihabitans sp. PAMC28606]UDL95513.1 phage GP46 family protein [Lichenihabitans sp. PAMC28606]